MICPKCKADNTRVIDSRETNEQREIRRRRKCVLKKCQYRFTTFERMEGTNFLVIKKDNTREMYDRKKLEDGIWKACEKRPVTKEQVDELLTNLEERWGALGKEINADTIGEGVMEMLKKLDEVAYIRFASVYRQFKDIDTFRSELQKLLD